MGEVIVANIITKLDVPVERILDGAQGLASIVVMGYDQDGNEYFASSIASGDEVLWLMERSKMKLLTMSEED